MSQVLVQPSNCCSPCEDQPTTQIPGSPGLSAYEVAVENGFVGTEAAWLASLDGDAGENSFTDLTDTFTMPAASATDIAEVSNSDWAVVGQVAFLEGAGYLEVVSKPDSTHVELENLDYSGNVVAGTVIAAGSHLGPGGIKGEDGSNATGDMLGSNNLSELTNTDIALATLGGTTVGINCFKLGNPSAITFPRINADNTVTARSSADYKTDLGLVIGTNVQAYDADLTTWGGISPSANVQTFVSAANFAAMRTALGVIADNYALYEHRQADGVDGGDFTNGAWRTVPINTEVSDVSGIGTLAANEVTLIAGTYRFTAWTNAYNVTNAQARLWNNTAASVITYGRCAISAGASTQLLLVEGRFTIGVASAIRLEAQCSVTEAADGFGKALSFGGREVYAGITFIKE